MNPKYRKYCKDRVFSYKALPPGMECVNDVGLEDVYITVPCGKCVMCRKKEYNSWRVRLIHEVQDHIRKYGPTRKKKTGGMYFVTITLHPRVYEKAKRDPHSVIREFLEDYRNDMRKKYPGKANKHKRRSLRHWIVTELGETTHRLHYHGILFGVQETKTELRERLSKIGHCFIGYVTERTASYITKYMLKPQLDEDWYKPRKFVSAGFGKCYCTNPTNVATHNRGDGKYYIELGKFKCGIPRYYLKYLFPEDWLLQRKYLNAIEPPSFWRLPFGIYTDYEVYKEARDWYYRDSLRRGTSQPLWPNYPSHHVIERENILLNIKPLQMTLWDF